MEFMAIIPFAIFIALLILCVYNVTNVLSITITTGDSEMGKRENKVETYLKQRVEKLGGTSRKWVSPGVDGVPDQIIIMPERTIFAELKTVDGSLSSAQAREHVRLRGSGAVVITIYGASGVDNFIADLLENSFIKAEYR